MISREQLIKKYLEFFKSKKHKVIPSASLIPENDPTVLFTTAGMHPLVPYLSGQPHPLGKRLASVQKCIRTVDIDEVGDNVHHTFFEMLGNWSLGDYWKEKAIKYSYEFLTKELKIPREKLAVTCFGGDERESKVPKDKESAEIWASLGIPEERIIFLKGGVHEQKNNWWGPAGHIGPCGPDTEVFYYIGKKAPKVFNPEDKTWVEIGNNVLMQYIKDEKGNYKESSQKNVDFGGGFERTLAILNGLDDNYLTEVWKPIIKEIEKISDKKYGSNKEITKSMKIIADHIKAAVFIIADGVVPSNTEQGYILRRLIRRAIRHGRRLNLKDFTTQIAQPVFEIYQDFYSELKKNRNFILTQLSEEENKFNKTLEKGLMIFNKKVIEWVDKEKKKVILSGKDIFLLYQSYGFPIEMIEEEVKDFRAGLDIKIDKKGFEEELRKHQELSRTASVGVFKSGLADNSIQTTKLHTATHLLNEALRKVLGEEVKQRGSNITPERLRFDFNFSHKLTDEEINKIETLVNKKIQQALKVVRDEMSLKQALESGAQSEFRHKYPDKVSVYTILDPSDKKGWFSREICTGPHVTNTKEIGKFKITKEESVAAGIRRIKAIVN